MWNEEFWQNPWDLGALIVIGLFIFMFLFFILFAVVFGCLYREEETKPEED
uniref:small integral membrane protein 6 n=1 Tax=Jaculus jaculus TaxID=51337 RepID=UPI001E1B3DE6|nr:small integral membrane protein 6 [Jaculus jaculus]